MPRGVYDHYKLRGRIKVPTETRICECGCEETFECKINSKQRFINGHNRRGKPSWNRNLTKEVDSRLSRLVFGGEYIVEVNAILRGEKEAPFCACGCGERIVVKPYHSYYGIPKYIRGHHNRVESYRKNQSERHKGKPKPGVSRALKGKSKPLGFGKIISKALKGKCRSDESVRKSKETMGRLWQDSEYKERQLSFRNPKAPNPKNSKNMKRLWQDPEFVKMMIRAQHRKPNRVEKRLDKFLQEIVPGEYQINVNAEVMILVGKVPDFVNVNGQKKIIEFNGDYWHSEERTGRTKEEEEQQRIDCFAKEGYQTLIVWECELKDIKRLKKKILEFSIKNNDKARAETFS